MINQRLWVRDLDTGELLFPAFAGGVDNTTLDTGSGGDTIATDDIAGVKFQRVKLVEGADGVNDGDISSANPLPVDVSDSSTRDLGIATVDNAGTFATQVDGAALTALQLIDNMISGSGANISQMNGVNVTMGNGVSGTGVQRVSLASDSTGNIASIGTSVTPGTGAANLGKAEDAAHGSGDTGVMALAVRRDADTSLVSATNDYAPLQVDANGRLKVEIFDGGDSHTVDGTVSVSGTVTVDLGVNNDVSLNAGSNLVGDVGISGARTSGGTTLYKNIDVDETEDQVKGTAGQVYWIHAINLKATPLYLKLYNATAATVVVGTTVPDLTFPVPSQGDTNGAGFTLSIPNGIAFSTAITVAATTGVADADSGAPGANELILNMGYA